MSTQAYTNRLRILATANNTKVQQPRNIAVNNNSLYSTINCNPNFKTITYNPNIRCRVKCPPPVFVPTIVTQLFNTRNAPFIFSNAYTYVIPTISPLFYWETTITCIGGNSTPSIVTNNYYGGESFYIMVGNPGFTFGAPPFTTVFSGTFPSSVSVNNGVDIFGQQIFGPLVCSSLGGGIPNAASVTFTLTLTLRP